MVASIPKFSVIITCYNYERYIALSIESAVNQTFGDREVIVVNDGSTDNSDEVIKRYSDQITYISTANAGFISACLTGLAASTGSYIIFLDADDILSRDALLLASQHADGNVSKIQFMLQPINSDGENIGDPFPRLGADYSNEAMIASINRFGYYSTPSTSGNIYRRDIYLSLGSLKYDYGIDGVAYLVAPFRGIVVHLDQVLGQYRIHGQNMSGYGSDSYSKMERENAVFLQRLDHLTELVGSQRFTARQSYLYVAERRVFIALAKGSRPSAAIILEYMKQIGSTSRPSRRIPYLMLAALLYLLPQRAAASLMDFTVNPRRASWLRTLVKRVARR